MENKPASKAKTYQLLGMKMSLTKLGWLRYALMFRVKPDSEYAEYLIELQAEGLSLTDSLIVISEKHLNERFSPLWNRCTKQQRRKVRSDYPFLAWADIQNK